jgi:hypothetical protein
MQLAAQCVMIKIKLLLLLLCNVFSERFIHNLTHIFHIHISDVFYSSTATHSLKKFLCATV